MFLQRLLRDTAVEHQPEQVQMDVLIRNGLSDHVVSGHLDDRVVEMRIRARKPGIAAGPVHRRLSVAHVGGSVFKLAQAVGGQVLRRQTGAFRL